MDFRMAGFPATTDATAVVWLDRTHAMVARARDGHSVVTEVDRDLDPETEYLVHVANAAAGCDRVVIMGADASRIAFEREYVALYRRPDRLIDLGSSPAPARSDLIDQLRVIEPTLR